MAERPKQLTRRGSVVGKDALAKHEREIRELYEQYKPADQDGLRKEDFAKALDKKNDNFTIRNRRAQDGQDILPSGGARRSAHCPHAPVTLHCNTCGGCRDARAGHYLCFSGEDK